MGEVDYILPSPVDIKAAVDILRVSRQHVYALIRRGWIQKSRRENGRRVFDLPELLKASQRLRAEHDDRIIRMENRRDRYEALAAHYAEKHAEMKRKIERVTGKLQVVND